MGAVESYDAAVVECSRFQVPPPLPSAPPYAQVAHRRARLAFLRACLAIERCPYYLCSPGVPPMPAGRPRNHAKHLSAAVDDLVRAIDGLVGTLGRASQRAAQMAATPRGPGQHRAGRKNPRRTAAIRASWARYTPAQRRARSAAVRAGFARANTWGNYTPAQRAARIAAMRAGHARRRQTTAKSAAPKSAVRAARRVTPRRATKAKPAPVRRKSAWAAMNPEQRAARIAKMQAGRVVSDDY